MTRCVSPVPVPQFQAVSPGLCQDTGLCREIGCLGPLPPAQPSAHLAVSSTSFPPWCLLSSVCLDACPLSTPGVHLSTAISGHCALVPSRGPVLPNMLSCGLSRVSPPLAAGCVPPGDMPTALHRTSYFSTLCHLPPHQQHLPPSKIEHLLVTRPTPQHLCLINHSHTLI